MWCTQVYISIIPNSSAYSLVGVDDSESIPSDNIGNCKIKDIVLKRVSYLVINEQAITLDARLPKYGDTQL